jgi:hypothetical protein
VEKYETLGDVIFNIGLTCDKLNYLANEIDDNVFAEACEDNETTKNIILHSVIRHRPGMGMLIDLLSELNEQIKAAEQFTKQ